MSTRYPMRCRFSEACGTFSNAVALRQHYDAAHASEYTPSKVKPLREVKAAPTPVVAPRPTHEHTAPDPEPLEPMSVDDIVLPAITALAMPGSVVPVAHLGALFLWRDQTAAMLAAISGKTP